MIARWLGRWRRKRPFAPRALIFDFDGTIGDTFHVGLEILNQLSEEFGFRRLDMKDVSRAREMRVGQFLAFLGIPKTKVPRISKRGAAELRRRIHEIRPFPGMVELLADLQQGGCRLGIITSNTDDNVRAFLGNHNLGMFDFVRCSSKLMGKAGIIRTTLRREKLARHEVLYIGDEVRDIEACRKVGIRIAAVTWGYGGAKSLAAQNPDALLHSPGELPAFLRELQGAR